MFRRTLFTIGMLLIVLASSSVTTTRNQASAQAPAATKSAMQKRWFFVWRDMSDPKEVDRMIARFPQAHAEGYNGVAFSANVPASKAIELRTAAQKYGIALVAIVMGGNPDRNYVEGVLSKDALFTATNGVLTFQPDNPTKVVNSNFENTNGNHMVGWGFQDDEGVTTFADHQVTHGGSTSLRMESFGKNPAQHTRIAQPIKLQPYRQYRISVWVKTENIVGAQPEVKVLNRDASSSISFQTFHCDPTQDWKHYDLSFNSLNNVDANLYLGTWSGKSGKIWWADLKVEEMALVNILRRPGTPVTVHGDGAASGTVYQEGKDFEKIVDTQLHPWAAYHEPPVVRLLPGSRIKEGDKLRISYYHPMLVYEDRLTYCLSEEKIFEDWRKEIQAAEDLLHPAAFFMSHDELRCINQCAACQAKHMTPGELLAWNVHRAALIIRVIRPDAEIWVWNDMFDPLHNAVDNFYAVNGSLKGSWKGLDKGIGIVNWHGGLKGKNCPFFAGLGLREILSGYYDSDEDGAGIAEWIANTKAVPGIVGAMYTTWEDRYDAMAPWAKKAWGK